MTRFHVEGMVCSGCERTVCRALRKLPGVKDARADYKSGKLEMAFSAPCTQEKIEEAVRQAGYEITSQARERRTAVYWLVIVVGLYVIVRQLGIRTPYSTFPAATGTRGSYVSLFLIGLMTPVHCVAMCGGLNAAQSMCSDSRQVFHASLMYNLGRLCSFTLVSGILGFIGEKAAVTLGVRVWIGAAAGIWMLLLGVKMLTCISIPFRLRVHFPTGLQALVLRLSGQGSFALGLMNALMPCGPLQSMQLYVVASGIDVQLLSGHRPFSAAGGHDAELAETKLEKADAAGRGGAACDHGTQHAFCGAVRHWSRADARRNNCGSNRRQRAICDDRTAQQ